MSLFRVLEGVHRCVAARRAGLSSIRARVDVQGCLGPVVEVALADVFTAKTEIGRWDRHRDFLGLVALMQDEEKRAAIPPVELVEVSATVARYLTPVSVVVVTDA